MRSSRHVLLLSAALALSCGKKKPSAVVTQRAAAPGGRIAGLVVEAETGAPVANADVELMGAMRVRTRADGSFEADVPARRVPTRVSGPDWVPVQRDLVVGEAQVPVVFKVARRSVARPVGRAPAMVTDQDFTLEVPGDAYPDGAMVSLTGIPRRRISAAPAPAQFVDGGGSPRRVLSTVALQSSTPPRQPVRLRVPVAPEASMDNVQLFRSDDQGGWAGEPMLPTSVQGGFATFSVSGDGNYGVGLDLRRAAGAAPGYLVVDGGDTLMDGDLLPMATDVETARRGVSLVDPQGSRVDVAPASRVHTQAAAQENGEFPSAVADSEGTGIAPFSGRIDLLAGTVRIAVAPDARGTGAVRFELDTPHQVLKLHGGAALTASVEACGSGTLETVQVTDGMVGTYVLQDDLRGIPAGSVAVVCKGCPRDGTSQCGAAHADAAAPPRESPPFDAGAARPDAAAARPESGTVPVGTLDPPGADAMITRYAMSLTPMVGFFPSVAVGSTAAMPFRLMNTGNVRLPPITFQLSGPELVEFTVQPSPCADGIDVQQSCQFTVEFRPRGEGQRQANLFISASMLASIDTLLQGTGARGSAVDAAP